jgi:hypothetical protein
MLCLLSFAYLGTRSARAMFAVGATLLGLGVALVTLRMARPDVIFF